ncbi:MAG TPA: hypothetical protein ENI23_12710 [bacterium]|nr:hypothetical protein [bacterium]
MPKQHTQKNGGLPSKIGKKFHEAIERIKDAKLRNGTLKHRLSTEKLTNLIIRHNDWEKIVSHIIAASEEEVNRYGV